MSMSPTKSSTRILILGGGFAGTSVAIRLGKLARHRDDVTIDFVSNENYFVFQPMLPEVAAGTLEATHIVNPIRRLCPYVNFHRAAVDEIDLTNKTVKIIGSDLRREKQLKYDHLVLTMGTIVDLRRNPGMAEHSLAMKTLGDAFYLRNEVINKLEQADIEEDEEHRRRLLTFVVVGGGFSGVETVAEINDMIKEAIPLYRRIPKEEVRVFLIHSRERILQELSEGLAEFAQKKLRARGVEIILKTRVAEATGDRVIFKGGDFIDTATIICTIGNAPHPVISTLNIANPQGRLDTNPYLQVLQKDEDKKTEPIPGLWSMGDCAFVPDLTKQDKDGADRLCPPTAQYAIRQGSVCANNIWAALHKKKLRVFKFGGLGQMAVIGRLTGVAEIMGFKFSGFIAFFLWRFVYWMKLPGFYAKCRVAIDWVIDLVFPKDLTQLNVFRTEKVARSHYCAGSYIFKQEDIGDSFYVIEKGSVEIVREDSEQEAEYRLATLTEGDSFGEIALLKKIPRSASVRCLTAVDVISMSRSDFNALSSTFRQFRDDLHSHVERIMKRNRMKIASGGRHTEKFKAMCLEELGIDEQSQEAEKVLASLACDEQSKAEESPESETRIENND
jgi:NADH dehydrogenase